MSQGNASKQTFNLQRLTETIDANIDEGAKKTEEFFSSACIYRVPEAFRKLKESAYTPHLIAIGPLHRNDKHLQTPMQYVKMSYTNRLLSRLTKGQKDHKLAKQKRSSVLEECVVEMKQSIGDANKWYAEEVTLDEEMLLVDGCFIIELLYRSLTEPPPKLVEESTKPGSKADPIYRSSLTASTIQLDLLLFENQIPFFVLEKLFVLTIDKIPNRPDKKTLNELALVYFGNMMTPENNSTDKANATTTSMGKDVVKSHTIELSSSTGKYNHILHLLHEYYRPLVQTKKTLFSEHMPSASNLEYAGVKFVPGKGNDLFNVKFIEPPGVFKLWRRGHFEIPTLGIYDLTEAFLRNMIAFEQCYHEVSKHFTSYAYLMDMLVNSEEDVETLERAGVMRNYLGANEDAKDLFNKLCKDTILGGFYFAETCNKATEFSKRWWPKNMAHLRRKYFASPWTFIAFCVGFLAFAISVTRFVQSFLK